MPTSAFKDGQLLYSASGLDQYWASSVALRAVDGFPRLPLQGSRPLPLSLAFFVAPRFAGVDDAYSTYMPTSTWHWLRSRSTPHLCGRLSYFIQHTRGGGRKSDCVPRIFANIGELRCV